MLLTAYLPDSCLLILDQGAHQAAEHFWQDVCNRHQDLNIDPRRPLLPPQELFSTCEELFAALRPYPRFELLRDTPATEPRHVDHLPFTPAPDLMADARKQTPWQKLVDFNQQWTGRMLLTAESPGRREALLEQLQQVGLQAKTLASWPEFLSEETALAIAVAPLSGSFLIGSELAVIPESDLLGGRVVQQRREARNRDGADAVIRNLAELTIGAAVVHIDHGVGRYLGLQSLDVDDQPMEFLVLQYADEAKLYVPVSSLHLINRYTGVADDTAPLHRLGSDAWQREREKAARQIRDAAAELLEIYARRAARPGEALSVDEQEYRRFSAEFPFEETQDQHQAISAVEADLARSTPIGVRIGPPGHFQRNRSLHAQGQDGTRGARCQGSTGRGSLRMPCGGPERPRAALAGENA